MPGNITSVDEESLRKDIKNHVKKTVEETLNAPLDGEASEPVGTASWERTAGSEAYRGATFQTVVIECCRRRETSVEEAIEDVSELLWGAPVSPGTVSNLSERAVASIEAWRSRLIEGEHPYLLVDGIYLKRSWGARTRTRQS